MDYFEVFRSFYDEKEARSLAALLDARGIQCKIVRSKQVLDKVFIGVSDAPDIHLKIPVSDFHEANKIIDEVIEKDLDAIDSDYYLYAFTDAELLDILRKPDEWNNQDVIIARKILNERGLDISTQQVTELKHQRVFEMARPERQSPLLLLRGYALAILFPVIGLPYSLLFFTAKKILPDGNKVNAYDRKSRDHFSLMLVISVLMIILVIVGLVRKNVISPPGVLLNCTGYVKV